MSTAVGPLPVGGRFAAYVAVARMQVLTRFRYRSDLLFTLFGLFVQIYLVTTIWEAVFPASGRVATTDGTVALTVQIAYATLALLQHWVFQPWEFTTVPERIREGKIAVDLVRPIGFPGQMLAAQAGLTVAVLPFAMLALPFAVLVGGATPPASPGAAAAYAVSLVPAYLISLLMSSVVGMVAFWTLQVEGAFVVYRMVGQFLSGALVPLWFMPGWLASVTSWLPFQATVYTPVALYLGWLSGTSEVVEALLVQWAWVAVLALVLRGVWARALHRVVVQGG